MKKFFNFFQRSQDGKVGTLKGVYIPNILQMIGVILFMRLGWITGHVGMLKMSIIITLSSTLLFLTGLAMTSIVSNMKVEGGGAYYIISRSLGIEFGSAIGILLCIAQHASIALTVTGFSVSLHEFLPNVPLHMLKIGTLTFLGIITYLSTEFALKAQIINFVVIILAVISIFFGNAANIPENIVPLNVTTILPFWLAFALFFPATTGIEAGLSMSGDLKKPSQSLPIGTLAAVVTAYILYLSISLFLNKNVSVDILKSHPFIVFHLSKVNFLVILGVWGATLSSALGSILGAPRNIQAIAKDGILPKFLAKGYGPTNQPRTPTLMVFCTSFVLTVLTDINQILPILSMTCLVTYGLINFVAFFEQLIQNPSWRPTFRIHWSVSLIGTLACFMAMFMINPGATFIVVALTFALCALISKKSLSNNWDDMRYSVFSYLINKGTQKLSNLENNPKSWRPHILALFDANLTSKSLAYFAHALNQEKSFLTFGVCIPKELDQIIDLDQIKLNYKSLFKSLNIPSYLHITIAKQPLIGMKELIRNYGLGPLKPNTIVLPLYKKLHNNEDFIKLIIDSYYHGKNLILLRNNQDNADIFSTNLKKNKQINLWWGGKYKKNFELSLALANILQNSPIWASSKISIKTIVDNIETQEKQKSRFAETIKNSRLKNCSFEAIIDPERNFFSNLSKHSESADLTFLGMRCLKENESPADYMEYCSKIFENTHQLNNVAFILSSENISFDKIFT